MKFYVDYDGEILAILPGLKNGYLPAYNFDKGLHFVEPAYIVGLKKAPMAKASALKSHLLINL